MTSKKKLGLAFRLSKEDFPCILYVCVSHVICSSMFNAFATTAEIGSAWEMARQGGKRVVKKKKSAAREKLDHPSIRLSNEMLPWGP